MGEPLNFKNQIVFGKTFIAQIESAQCKVSGLLFNGKLSEDGTFNIKNMAGITVDDVWSYIYYLYFYNKNNNDIFMNMKSQGEREKASAIKMYNAVYNELELNSRPYSHLEPHVLATFTNNILKRYGEEINNPVIDFLGYAIQKIYDSTKKGLESSNTF